MDSQRLVRELEQLKTGEPESEFRFLSILAGSNAFLLTEDEIPDESGGSLKVKVHLVRRDGYRAACLFSSQDALQGWCSRRGIEAYCMPVVGADLAFALPSDTWIEIDPDTSRSVTLSPAHLTLLSAQGAPDLTVPSPVTPSPQVEDAVARDDGFELVDASGRDSSQPDQPPAGAAAHSGPAAPIKRRFNRSNPTTLFQPPVIERKAEVERPRTYTSSNLKKVIRPPKAGDDE